MDRLLPHTLGRFIRKGTVQVTAASGFTFTLGDGTGTPIAVRFTSRVAQWGVLMDPELRLGEAYMDGTLVVEHGSIRDLLALALSPEAWTRVPWWLRPYAL